MERIVKKTSAAAAAAVPVKPKGGPTKGAASRNFFFQFLREPFLQTKGKAIVRSHKNKYDAIVIYSIWHPLACKTFIFYDHTILTLLFITCLLPELSFLVFKFTLVVCSSFLPPLQEAHNKVIGITVGSIVPSVDEAASAPSGDKSGEAANLLLMLPTHVERKSYGTSTTS